MTSSYKRPSLFISLVPVVVLVALLFLNVVMFQGDASWGPNQIALIIGTSVVGLLAISLGYKWKAMLKGMSKSISSTIPAIMILLLIGALTGTWMISGVIPTMIYYGLEILNPTIFLFAACMISAIVSVSTGSSWSTVGTVGIALLGIGETLGFGSGLVAGAVISGAYFGDKMSPLSDTTNLAPAMAGTDLFTHIKHMSWTTVPSITITLIIFLFIGFSGGSDYNSGEVTEMMSMLNQHFFISPILFIVPVGVILLILLRVPAIPALLAGTLLGGLMAIVTQPEIVRDLGEKYTVTLTTEDANVERIVWNDGDRTEGQVLSTQGRGEYTAYFYDGANQAVDSISIASNDIILGSRYGAATDPYGTLTLPAKNLEVSYTVEPSSYLVSSYNAITRAMYGSTAVSTQNDQLNDLLTGKGMEGMLTTIWLIICAMTFGGLMETTGMLARITDAILTMVRSTGSLIFSTVSTCLFFNFTASDQYLAIVVPGRMFASTYRSRGIKPENLSRTLEDSGTVTSALIPWNTCGAYHSTTLGVATGEYWIYAFFNLISPVMTILYGYLGWKVPHYSEAELAALQTEEEED